MSANVAYAYALVKAMLLEEYIKDEDEPMPQNSLNQFVTPEMQILRYELNCFVINCLPQSIPHNSWSFAFNFFISTFYVKKQQW